jgi:hypothetical protein
MKVLCAFVRPRGQGEYQAVAMMPITRRTVKRDYVVFRGSVSASYPGRMEFRFEETEVPGPRRTRKPVLNIQGG